MIRSLDVKMILDPFSMSIMGYCERSNSKSSPCLVGRNRVPFLISRPPMAAAVFIAEASRGFLGSESVSVPLPCRWCRRSGARSGRLFSLGFRWSLFVHDIAVFIEETFVPVFFPYGWVGHVDLLAGVDAIDIFDMGVGPPKTASPLVVQVVAVFSTEPFGNKGGNGVTFLNGVFS